jgi:hypothetical protein
MSAISTQTQGKHPKENIFDFKTIGHLVGFLFIVVTADARNHEPERDNSY